MTWKYFGQILKKSKICKQIGFWPKITVISAALSSTVGYLRKIPESKKENVERTADKQWWTNGFEKWDNDAFKHRIRVSRETLLLDQVRPFIEKEPTNMIPFPIEAHRQLGLTLYRLAHGVSYSTLADLFGVSMSLAERTFNQVVKIFARELYDVYLKIRKRKRIHKCDRKERKER